MEFQTPVHLTNYTMKIRIYVRRIIRGLIIETLTITNWVSEAFNVNDLCRTQNRLGK